MNRIEDIIGNKKYAGAITTNQSTRLLLEQPNKITYDNQLFDNVSQLQQFNTEKQTSNKFRFYGKINPIMSLDVFGKTVNGDVKINVDSGIFDMNLNNWSIVLLKAKSLPMINDSGTNVEVKGIKYINKVDDKKNTTFYLDLRKGLPARTYYNRINQTNGCLFFPLGHNFNIGDKIYVTSKNSYNVPTGMYKVTGIDVDKVFINTRVRSFYAALAAAPASLANTSFTAVNDGNAAPTSNNTSAKLLSDYKSKNLAQINNNVLSTKLVVRNLTFSNKDAEIFNNPRPKIYPHTEAEYSVAKVIEKEQLEYYIKTLEVIDVIDELDICGFSANNFNEAIMNFYVNQLYSHSHRRYQYQKHLAIYNADPTY